MFGSRSPARNCSIAMTSGGEQCQRVRNLESKGKGGEVRQLEEKKGEAMEDSVGQRELGFMWILKGLTGLDEIYVFRRYLYLVG